MRYSKKRKGHGGQKLLAGRQRYSFVDISFKNHIEDVCLNGELEINFTGKFLAPLLPAFCRNTTK